MFFEESTVIFKNKKWDFFGPPEKWSAKNHGVQKTFIFQYFLIAT